MLVPAVVVIGLLLLLGFLGYKYRVGQMLAHMKMGLEKRAPPGAEREVTLVLTDIQVGGNCGGRVYSIRKSTSLQCKHSLSPWGRCRYCSGRLRLTAKDGESSSLQHDGLFCLCMSCG